MLDRSNRIALTGLGMHGKERRPWLAKGKEREETAQYEPQELEDCVWLGKYLEDLDGYLNSKLGI